MKKSHIIIALFILAAIAQSYFAVYYYIPWSVEHVLFKYNAEYPYLAYILFLCVLEFLILGPIVAALILLAVATNRN